MQFLVHGVDGPVFDFGPDDRHEAHQAYMDGWLPRMIARGPTLSPDGEQHTGSIHVLDLPDAGTARRFATEEPYASAGWYRQVTVDPILPALTGTMWDRPAPVTGQVSSFLRAAWTGRPLDAAELARRLDASGFTWLFAGLLLGETGGHSTGFAGAVDASPADAAAALTTIVGGGASPEIHRWQRGGRNQG